MLKTINNVEYYFDDETPIAVQLSEIMEAVDELTDDRNIDERLDEGFSMLCMN